MVMGNQRKSYYVGLMVAEMKIKFRLGRLLIDAIIVCILDCKPPFDTAEI